MTFSISGVVKGVNAHPDKEGVVAIHVNLIDTPDAAVKGGDIVLYVDEVQAANLPLGQSMSFSGWENVDYSKPSMEVPVSTRVIRVPDPVAEVTPESASPTPETTSGEGEAAVPPDAAAPSTEAAPAPETPAEPVAETPAEPVASEQESAEVAEPEVASEPEVAQSPGIPAPQPTSTPGV